MASSVFISAIHLGCFPFFPFPFYDFFFTKMFHLLNMLIVLWLFEIFLHFEVSFYSREKVLEGVSLMSERRNTHLVGRFSLLLSRLEGNNYRLFICLLGHYFVVIGIRQYHCCTTSHHLTHFERRWAVHLVHLTVR